MITTDAKKRFIPHWIFTELNQWIEMGNRKVHLRYDEDKKTETAIFTDNGVCLDFVWSCQYSRENCRAEFRNILASIDEHFNYTVDISEHLKKWDKVSSHEIRLEDVVVRLRPGDVQVSVTCGDVQYHIFQSGGGFFVGRPQFVFPEARRRDEVVRRTVESILSFLETECSAISSK